MVFILMIFIFQYIFTLIMITIINMSIYFNVNVIYTVAVKHSELFT